MVQIIQANKVTLGYLEDKFHLQLAANDHFFTEWVINLPALSDLEKQALDRIKSNYLHLTKRRPMIESIVKMVVLSPLLELAGFYQPPFEIDGEPGVEISVEDEEEVVKGEIDVLVLHNQLWVLVIESKIGVSIEVGIPQALAYMLGNLHPDKPIFGLITNGSHFIFLKLVQDTRQDAYSAQYAMSDEFSLLKRENDLYRVLSILKGLGGLIMQ
ncbi:restriction endonuclease subunit R [Coleofasciculus sp. H7-2]|uniref:restriction endonuclease subunit R n=1 Tax=Coleofasciculus sp. H7-2 TaxID=3351545 RepID=UPI00366F6179